MTKLVLMIDAWLEFDGKKAPFGANGATGQRWYRVPPGAGLKCKRCGKSAAAGWRRGINGKTAYCSRCVVLRETRA